MSQHTNRFGASWHGLAIVLSMLLAAPGLAGERFKVSIESTVDGTAQPCYVILPEGHKNDATPRPLLVSLHTWSGDVEQRSEILEELAEARGWIYLFPNFRGANRHPESCGSPVAQQDILDAVAWARKQYVVDARRIYLTGVSGGGHMTLLMVGRHPHVWTAASAWVGISDLAVWYERHADDRYGEMMRLSCGGAPGDSPTVDRQYRSRSPNTHLRNAVSVPLDIAAGIHDGHEGSVPIRHSLEAFNVVAAACGAEGIPEAEILQLSRKDGRLENPRSSDLSEDASLERQIHLRRTAGPARVTIFEGGHEGIATAAIDWLARHTKDE